MEFVEKLRILYPNFDRSDAELLEVYHKDTGEYVNKAKEYKRSQRTKHAWRKKRQKYMASIKSYNRLPKISTISDNASSFLAKAKKEQRKEDDKQESLKPTLHDSHYYLILECLVDLKRELISETHCFRLEEKYIEVTDEIDDILETLTSIESSLISRSIDPESILVLEELLTMIQQCYEENQGTDEGLS